MILWSSDASPFARKARIVVLETGLSDRVEILSVKTSPVDTNPKLKAQNPLGKIPCLTLDDGIAVMDSRVICHYLDRMGQGASLHPSGNVRHNTLVALCDGILDAAVAIVYEARVRPEAFQYSPWVEAQWGKIDETLNYIAREYADLLEHFNMAAIGLICALEYLDFRLDARGWRALVPQLARWHDDIKERASFVATRPE